MKYELAKKLKGAGFQSKYLFLEGDRYAVHEAILIELIEACGDKFGSLTQYDREKGIGWFASGNLEVWDSDEGQFIQYEAPTMCEAVAYLWLALHKE